MTEQEIKDGAPSGAQYWRDMDSVCHPMEILYYKWFGGVLSTYEGEKGWVKSIYHDDNEYILDQLKPLQGGFLNLTIDN